MIRILESTPQQVESAASYFGRRLGNGEWIKAGLMSGFYRAETAKIDDKESYLAVFHINDQGSLVINAGARLGGGNPEKIVSCIRLLAEKHGCSRVECMTDRPVIVKTLMAGGFEPVGITLALNL